MSSKVEVMLKAIYFDIDDTLYDTSGFAKLARKAALNVMIESGLPLDQKEAYSLLRQIIDEKGSNYSRHFNVLTKRVFGEEKPILIALGMITYHNVKFALLRPFPHTISTLMYLKGKGYKLGVISNGITIKQWEKLIRLSIHHFFDEVVTSEEVGAEKPDTRIFKEALKRMGCKAKESIMVGDKFNEDILGALEVGMSAILVNSTLSRGEKEYIKREELNVKVIPHIGELKNIL